MLKSKLIPTSNPSGTLIGFKNLLTATTFIDAGKALTPDTYERWIPSGAIVAKFQMSSVADVDFIAIAAHDLAGETFVLSTSATVGGALTEIGSLSPRDNSAIMFSFGSRSIQEIVISSTLTKATEIGVVYAGKALQMPTNIYGGHSPINLSQKTEYQSPMSESGQFLGRNIIRKGLESSFSWQFLKPSFYRDEFQPFVESARTTPFFIKWRPDKFPDEVAYVHTTGDIAPLNMGGGNDLMSVSIKVRAHSDT